MRAFGPSSLDFELLAWIERPLYRGRVLDELNRRVYKAFIAAGIEIPYANVAGAPVTAESARAFGHDLAGTLYEFLREFELGDIV